MLKIIDLNSNFLGVRQGHMLHDLRIVKQSTDIFYGSK